MVPSRFLVLAGLAPIFALAGCGQADNGGFANPGDVELVTPDTPVPETPVEPGTVSDPASESCGAPKAKEFLGQVDSPEIRQKITEAAQAPGGIRFLPPGTAATQDHNPQRLNVMIDITNVVRDLRCG